MSMQSEFRRERRGYSLAQKRWRICFLPLLLFCLLLVVSAGYMYVRIVHGMAELTTGMQVYSCLVLAMEVLAALNVLGYSVWLFAKPVNTDVAQPPAQRVRQLRFAAAPFMLESGGLSMHVDHS